LRERTIYTKDLTGSIHMLCISYLCLTYIYIIYHIYNISTTIVFIFIRIQV